MFFLKFMKQGGQDQCKSTTLLLSLILALWPECDPTAGNPRETGAEPITQSESLDSHQPDRDKGGFMQPLEHCPHSHSPGLARSTPTFSHQHAAPQNVIGAVIGQSSAGWSPGHRSAVKKNLLQSS